MGPENKLFIFYPFFSIGKYILKKYIIKKIINIAIQKYLVIIERNEKGINVYMAIIKNLPATKKLEEQLEYLEQEEKTRYDLVSGINCTKDNILMVFRIIKELYNKKKGKEYYHITMAFSPTDNISEEEVHELGLEWIKKCIVDHQILAVTHIDKNHLHNHFIINSVNMKSGKKLQINPKRLYEMKVESNSICSREGLSTIELDKLPKILKTNNEYYYEKRGRKEGIDVDIWKDTIRNSIDYSISVSDSIDEFKMILKDNFGIDIVENRYGYRYILEDNKNVTEKRLGSLYCRNSILGRLR